MLRASAGFGLSGMLKEERKGAALALRKLGATVLDGEFRDD